MVKDNDIEMYSIHNEGKSAVAEIFIRTLVNEYNNIVNEYNNTYQRTIKMKPVDVKDNTYILIFKKKLLIKILNLKLAIM